MRAPKVRKFPEARAVGWPYIYVDDARPWCRRGCHLPTREARERHTHTVAVYIKLYKEEHDSELTVNLLMNLHLMKDQINLNVK